MFPTISSHSLLLYFLLHLLKMIALFFCVNVLLAIVLSTISLFRYILLILLMVTYITSSYLIVTSSLFITNCILCFSLLVYMFLLSSLVLILLSDYLFSDLLFNYLHSILILSPFPLVLKLERANSFLHSP